MARLPSLALALSMALWVGGWSMNPAQAAPPGEAEIVRACPDKPLAQPSKPRRVLVFTLARGYRHASIDTGARALKLLGERSGAFTATVSDDPALFEPDRLRDFDAIVMLSTTGELFTPPPDRQARQPAGRDAAATELRRKQALIDFVLHGGGLVGIHAATDCFYGWPEYGRLIGGYFDGHPWHEQVGLRVEEPDHPLVRFLPRAGFSIVDEIYQFRDPYDRNRLRVLLSLDPQHTDMHKPGMKRTDGDYPVTWVRRFGRGRVFYCSLGHRDEVFANPQIMRHYLAGIQYACGDLPADDVPRLEETGGWRRLFDGRSLAGWQTRRPGAWKVEDGVLMRAAGGSDIWTREQFGDFELQLQFKLAEGTNSGVFFRIGDLADPVQTGIEVQVLDSAGKRQVGRHDCGAIYDCLAPRYNAVRPPGQWNHLRLVCRGPKVHVELNGADIIDMDLDRWTQPHRNPDGSKNKFRTAYKDMPRRGYIGLQDHGKPVWYREIWIRPLD